MAVLWDTTLASRLQPDGGVIDYVVDRASEGDAVRIAAPAVLEIVYGYQRKAGTDSRFGELLHWFIRLVASEAFRVVPLDGRAAVVAGRVRAEIPHAPPKRRGDQRARTMRQASWLLDIEIAATAFAAGLDIATDNRADFEQISACVDELFPEAPPLVVTSAPA